MKIYLATDHAGFELKEKIKKWLQEWNYEYEDMGAHEYSEQDDYPDLIRPAAKAVAHDPENAKAIILGGSGQAEAMTANRYTGVRAVVFYGPVRPQFAADVEGRESEDPYEIIRLSREHNDANILSLGARFLSEDEAKTAVKLWLETPFSEEERHKRRINKLK